MRAAVIAATEIHDDRVVLNCLSVVEPEPALGMTDSQPARLELHDDVGTEYTPDGGGGAGTGRSGDSRRPSVRPSERGNLSAGRHADGTVVFML